MDVERKGGSRHPHRLKLIHAVFYQAQGHTGAKASVIAVENYLPCKPMQAKKRGWQLRATPDCAGWRRSGDVINMKVYELQIVTLLLRRGRRVSP